MTSESAQKQLESLLRDIATTRASLPALLRSFQTPSLSSAELAQLYSARSQAAFSSIKSLRESLAAAQGVLEAAKRSEEKDGSGIVVLQREAGESGIGLLELRRIFGEKDSGNGKKLSGKLAGRIMNDKEMDEVLSGWSSIYPRVRIEPRTNQRELRITYKGLMKVFLELHHSPTEIQVERILCHGLKEKIPEYGRSEFALFREITQRGMKILAADAVRRSRPVTSGDEEVPNLVEILEYVSDPPLPF